MSFYCYKNGNPASSPGVIAGDPVTGLQEKICAQVKRVYDSCMFQDTLTKEITFAQFCIVPKSNSTSSGNCVPAGQVTPATPQAPLTFESCRSSTTVSEITNLSVLRLCDRPCFARVKATVDLPIDILFSDANCNEYIGRAVVSIPMDVLLSIPDESIVPYTVDSMGSAICVSGSYIDSNKFKMTICVTVILKIVADVEVLLPSYGFCSIPACEKFDENVCEEFFSLPLFPPASLCPDGYSINGSTGSTGAASQGICPGYNYAGCGCAAK